MADGQVAARVSLVGAELVLRDVWVWLHWQVLSTPRRGGRVPRPDGLQTKLLEWLEPRGESDWRL
jgi:hypothetical protein